VRDAPLIAAALKRDPRVRDAVVVAFPDRRAGTALYAFIESGDAPSERQIQDIVAGCGARLPERTQVFDAMPRDGCVPKSSSLSP